MNHVYKSRKSTLWILFGTGLLILLPVMILVVAALFGDWAEAAGPAIVVGMITILPAVMLFVMAAAVAKLRIEIDESTGRIKARLPRKASLFFPWQVKDVDVPYASIQKIDVKQRANGYVSGGVETLYFLRTLNGDLFFHSQWFVKHEEIARRLTSLVATAVEYEDLDSPPVVAPGEKPRKLFLSEIIMRSFGYVGMVVSAVMIVLALLLIFFGEPQDRLGVTKGILVLTMALPATRWMTRYRAAR